MPSTGPHPVAAWTPRRAPSSSALSAIQCDCHGECGWHRCPTRWPAVTRCPAQHLQPHPVTGEHVELAGIILDAATTGLTGQRSWCRPCRHARQPPADIARQRKEHEQRLGMIPLWEWEAA